jgi:large subunit ribosomal protein L29
MKNQDIKQLSTKDLVEKINEEKAAYAKLKLNHAVSPVENPSTITRERKLIARLKTEMRGRQIAEAKK